MNIKSLVPFGSEHSIFPRAARSGLTNLQREIDRVFDDFSGTFGATMSSDLLPRMDVHETEKQIQLTVELPGLEEKDVDIQLSDNVLTIKGEKKSETKKEEGEARYSERVYGSFYRSIQLPAGFDQAAIKAELAKGILTVTVPKSPAAQAKKIEVQKTA